MKRIPQLDGIRGLAILLILIWHYYVFLPAPGSINSFIKKFFILTWCGVDLFFVLSGFLIGGILLDNKSAKNYYYTFYFRRICRILPIYFILLFFFFAIYQTGIWKSNPPLSWLFNNPLPLWSYITFTQNFFVIKTGSFGANGLGVTWSLAIEEQFYLILPFLIKLMSYSRLPIIIISLIIFAPLFRIILLLLLPTGAYAGFVLLPSRMDALFLGVLGAWMLRQKNILHLLNKRWLVYAATLIFGSIIPLLIYLYNKPGPTASLLTITIGLTFLAAFFLCLILLGVTGNDSIVKKLLNFRPLRGLGRVSYFVYLFHLIFLGLSHILILNQTPQNMNLLCGIVTIFALITTLTLATISWFIIEKPFIKYGHRTEYM